MSRAAAPAALDLPAKQLKPPPCRLRLGFAGHSCPNRLARLGCKLEVWGLGRLHGFTGFFTQVHSKHHTKNLGSRQKRAEWKGNGSRASVEEYC